MKARELRALSDQELDTRLDEFKQELFNLRWQSASHQNQNPKRANAVRKAVARILTIKTQRLREEADK